MGKTRYFWIDKLRCIAILLVLLCHSTEEGIYKLELDPVRSLPQIRRIFPFVCFTIGRISVPIFFLITGYLFLDRRFPETDSKKFWKNNWLHLIICTQFWFFLYDIFLKYHEDASLSFIDILQDLFFLNKVKMSHVWYMPVIIGLYACIPLVANSIDVIKNWHNRKLFMIPVIFFTVCLFFYPTFSIIVRNIVPNIRVMSNQIYYGFSGGTYGLYLVFGWLLKDGLLKKIKSGWLILIFLCACVSAVWIQLWSYNNGIRYNIWNDNPMILAAALAIFELLSRFPNTDSKFARFLSSYAFGIYLIHFPIKLLLLDHIMAVQCPKEIQVFLLFILSFGISLILAVLFSLIPKAGNYLLYRK